MRELFERPPLLHVAIDEGEGPIVVLLHGIASSSVTFENLVPLLTPTRRVIAIDLLGFGASPAPADCIPRPTGRETWPAAPECKPASSRVAKSAIRTHDATGWSGRGFMNLRFGEGPA